MMIFLNSMQLWLKAYEIIFFLEKKTFRCPTKKSSKVVCLQVLYPNIWLISVKRNYFYGPLERFWDIRYSVTIDRDSTAPEKLSFFHTLRALLRVLCASCVLRNAYDVWVAYVACVAARFVCCVRYCECFVGCVQYWGCCVRYCECCERCVR